MRSKHTYTPEQIQELFSSIGKLITSSLEISNTINAIMQLVEYFFQPKNWSILQVDPDKQELYFVIAKGLDQNIIKNFRLKMGEGIAGEVASTGLSVFIEDAQNDPRFSKKLDQLSGFTTKSIIAVPMIAKNKVLGVIELINADDQYGFTQQDLTILETIADFSAIALTNAMAYERISHLAIHDALTGLYNFAYLDNVIEEVSGIFSITDNIEPLYNIVIWVDVNDFKGVNDQYGHYVGNEVLIRVANLLQECCRKTDYAFRVGGDEFLIIITDLQEKEVMTFVKRLENKLQLASHDILPAQGFSYGIASGLKSSIKLLIQDADREMYRLKTHVKEKSDPA